MGIDKVIAGTDWTAVDTSGSLPPKLYNLSTEIVLVRLGGAGEDQPIHPGQAAQVKGNNKIVHVKSASGLAVVAVVTGLIIDGSNDVAIDAVLGAVLGWRLNPERSYILIQQESDSGQGDGTTEWFIDFLGYEDLTIQIQDTPGSAGLNTYKVYLSAEAGNIDDDSSVYEDIGSDLFGAASWTADAILINTKKFRGHYVKIERVRTGDDSNDDGGSLLDIQGG